MPLHFHYRNEAQVPLEVEGITPDTIADRSLAEVEKMRVFHGNDKATVADFFDVSGTAGDAEIRFEGELQGIHWIGARMKSGCIHVEGNAGRHLGSEMSGGRIEVTGDAGDWVGGEMRGGSIRIRGSAGHLVGAAYRGSPRGMRGGTILIDGNAGNEIGHTMRRGLIAVGGAIGDLAAFNMLAGTVLIFGESGIRHAAGMRRGTLAFLGPAPPLLPSFRRACRLAPLAMTLLMRKLQEVSFAVAPELLNADYDLYNGDMIEGGRGEILLRA